MGMAWLHSGPTSLYSDVCVTGEPVLLLSLGIRVSGSSAGRRRRPRVGCLPDMLESQEPPPSYTISLESQIVFSHSWGEPSSLLGIVIV